jgi:pyruvate-ferredoxin/flavodoxin oxidoreductase
VGCLTLAYGAEIEGPWSSEVDTIMVSGETLLSVVAGDAIRTGGRLVIASVLDGKAIWRGLGRRVESWIREHRLEVFVVDPLASHDSGHLAGFSPPSWSDQWAVWALLGAGLHLADPKLQQSCGEQLRALLHEQLGESSPLASEVISCFGQGQQVKALSWQQMSAEERFPQAELDAPWTVGQAVEQTQRLFDPVRFWHSVGFLHDSGQIEQALPDPLLATGVIPAGSSAHRNLSPHRYRTPSWLPENCTACGLCWSLCPDSSLPATLQPLEQWLSTAIEQCKAAGHALTQMNRITAHLVKMANQVLRKDQLKQHLNAGSLLEAAFVQLMDKMGLEDDALAAMRSEFDQVKSQLNDWPFARTDLYFDGPNKNQAGSGQLLTIPFNPSSCKGCGLCIEVCPENAFDWRQYATDKEQIDRSNWRFRMQLPDAIETGISHPMLHREGYYTMVGGDSAAPALGSKIAVHLLTAAIESVMKQRHRAHADYLAGLIEKLRAKIQGTVSELVEINDFDDFGQRLEKLDADLGANHLVELLENDASPQQPDKERLKRLSTLLQRLEAQRQLYFDGRRSRQLLALHPELGLWSGYYPDNPHANPWMSGSDQDTAAMAEGLFDGIARVHAGELAICRLAELELRDRFESGSEQSIPNWRQFSEAEMKLLPPVLMVMPSAGARWADIARLLAADRPIQVVLLDATGPDGSPREDHVMQALDQGRAAVLQSSIGYPDHLLNGVMAALENNSASLVQVHAPDPGRCGISTEQVADCARRAVDSRAVPLFGYQPQRRRLDLKANLEPQGGWGLQTLQLVEPQGDSRQLETAMTVADWAIRQGQFREHFQVMAKGHLNPEMKPLADYLVLDEEQRGSLQPYFDVTDQKGRHFIATPSIEMVALCEERLLRWKHLQAMAASDQSADDRSVTIDDVDQNKPQSELQQPVSVATDSHEALVERLLAMCGYAEIGGLQGQSLRSFLDSKGQAEEKANSE